MAFCDLEDEIASMFAVLEGQTIDLLIRSEVVVVMSAHDKAAWMREWRKFNPSAALAASRKQNVARKAARAAAIAESRKRRDAINAKKAAAIAESRKRRDALKAARAAALAESRKQNIDALKAARAAAIAESRKQIDAIKAAKHKKDKRDRRIAANKAKRLAIRAGSNVGC
jgi:hypothetical protein